MGGTAANGCSAAAASATWSAGQGAPGTMSSLPCLATCAAVWTPLAALLSWRVPWAGSGPQSCCPQLQAARC